MRLILAITMFNEVKQGPHVNIQLDNALELDCWDDIVVLDDGSTDSTWDVLQEYSRKYNNINIFRNDKNSVIHGLGNRWVSLLEHVEKFYPTWINGRAADVLHSYSSRDLYRDRIIELDSKGFTEIDTPYINLWRSNSWYRCDNQWGRELKVGHRTLWKYNKNFRWSEYQLKAECHLGHFKPSNLGYKSRPAKVENLTLHDSNVVLLHLGFSSYHKMVTKFRRNMELATAAYSYGRHGTMNSPDNMPLVSKWLNHCGYAAFYEFPVELKKVPSQWYRVYNDELKPEFNSLCSFYNIIKEFNEDRAKEYKLLWESVYGSL